MNVPMLPAHHPTAVLLKLPAGDAPDSAESGSSSFIIRLILGKKKPLLQKFSFFMQDYYSGQSATAFFI